MGRGAGVTAHGMGSLLLLSETNCVLNPVKLKTRIQVCYPTPPPYPLFVCVRCACDRQPEGRTAHTTEEQG